MSNLFYKVIILTIFYFLIQGNLQAQDVLTFVAEQDTAAYHIEDGNELKIHTGENIILNSKFGVTYGQIHTNSGFHLVILFGEGNNLYTAFAKYFRPLNTKDVFGNDLFIDFPIEHTDGYNIRQMSGAPIVIGDVDAMWVPDYYCDVLIRQEREKLLEILPGLSSLSGEIAGEYFTWYGSSQADIQNGRAIFYNSVIMLGMGTHIAVKNIHKIDFGYIVDGVISPNDRNARWRFVFLYGSAFWNTYNPGDNVTMFLNLDGDYLDVYIDGNDILLGTFVKVQREFIKQYQSLIKTNTCDLTNVIWPSRKNGNRHFTPPSVDLSRTNDEIISNNETSDNIDSHESTMVQDNTEKSSLPLPLLLMIIGGVTVIAVVVVVVLRKRK